MHCLSMHSFVLVLQLHFLLQMLCTPNCYAAVDFLKPLGEVQKTVARWPSTAAGNENLKAKANVNHEEREHSFHSRRPLQRQSTEPLSGDDFPCLLNETELEAIVNETTRIWLIDKGVLTSFNSNIQAIISCTTENDTVFFRTENLVTPQTTITIPWNLTLSGFFEGNPTGRERVPEANSKVSFTCPENGQLFVARTPAFVLANVAVLGCNSSSDIILLEPRCVDDLESDARSHLVHVDFARNTLLQNGSLLNATKASCTQLTLEDVKFNGNRCNGEGCVLITKNTELHKIRASRNRKNSDSSEECSLFSIQNVSHVVAVDVSARKNKIRVLHTYNSTLRIRDSHFQRNNRTQNSIGQNQMSGGGALFANMSRIFIERSTFQKNSALSGGALYVVFTELSISNCKFSQNNAWGNRESGGAIYSLFGSVLILASTKFSRNVAWKGGALSTNTTNISLSDGHFISNNATRSGACSFWGSSSIQIERALFDGNRATERFGGAIVVFANVTIEIRNSTFQNNRARGNTGAVDVSSQCHLLLSDVVFINNTAGINGSALQLHTFTVVEVIRSNFTENRGHLGGAAYLRSNSSLSISHSTCTQNEASNGGCLYGDLTTNIKISESSLEGNKAAGRGGAIHHLNNSTLSVSNTFITGNEAYSGGALHVSDVRRVNISSCLIEGNTANFTGGGITSEANVTLNIVSSSLARNEAQLGGGLHIQANSTLMLSESQLVSNSASVGGCLYLRASNAFISNSSFRNSQARDQGGAVYMHRNASLFASNLTLIRNRARGGGAIRMTEDCMALIEYSTFVDNRATTGGGLRIDRHCAALLSSSSFRNNTARNGGAIVLESSNLTVLDTLMSANKGRNNGGGIHMSGLSFLNATGLSLVSNLARVSGGGICLSHGSLFLCYACLLENNAASNGAGIYGHSIRQNQPIRAQLQDSNFTRNSALFSGGGLQFDTPQERNNRCLQESLSCGSIVLLNSSFVDNSAVLYGSAILLSNPESILVASTVDREQGFLDIARTSWLSPVDPQGQYNSWTGNRVLSKDAGGVVGTYGRSLSLSTNSSSENQIISIKESGFLLPNVQSGNELPTIQIIAMDAFGDGPAPTIPHTFSVSVISPESFFQGVITVNVSNGTGFLTNVAGFGIPDNYSLKITPLNNAAIEETTLRIQVRECVVGEEPTQDRRLCQRCGESSYNFDTQEADGCKPCPEHAACGGRYVIPTDGYWHKGPCHANITQCITEEACTYDQREGKLLNFSENFTDCGMSGETLLNYSELLCRQGYEGPLCGSCTQSYGLSIVYKCSKCPHAMESLITLALLVFYLLVIFSFTLRGGLSYQTKHRSVVRRRSSESTVIWNSSRSVAINIQMVEMLRDGYVPPEVMQQPQYTNRSTPSNQHRNKAEMTGWKTSEILKITINFLQVTAAAAGIAVHWTDGVMEMFKASEIAGALTTVALFRPVDCIFPSNSALARSVLRITFGVLVPGIVFGIFISFWGATKMWKKKPMSFFWKRSLLSLVVVVYISYLGLTKLAVRVFYCAKVFDSENPFSASRTSYWAVDTAIKCYGKDHSILVTIGVFVLMSVTLSFPLISAVVISRCKEQQEISESWTNETMGFLYRAFTDKFRYWESIVMLRKAFLSVIVVFSYPLGGQLQALLASLLLMFSLCLQTVCRPYRREFNTLNHYEFSSLFVSCVTLTLGQFLDSDRCSSFVKRSVAFLIVFINTLTFLVLLLAYLSSGVDHLRAVLEDEGIQIPDNSRWWSVLKIVCTTKISQWCDSAS